MNDIEGIVVGELEGLLDRVAPKEADFATMYVRESEARPDASMSAPAFGTPMGETLIVVGPFLAHFLCAIAVDILKATQKEGVSAVAKQFIAYVGSKFRKRTEKVTTKAQTKADIEKALLGAGWTEQRAKEAAEATWVHGEEIAARVSKLN